MQIHGYPYSDAGSTFIVEMHEDVWRAGRLRRDRDESSRPGPATSTRSPGSREIFADELRGHQVLTNNSKWLNFTTVRNERWHDGNLVLLGDAAHTAHFSIGSGTKLAMEDALALAACLHEQPTRRGGARRLPGRAQAGRRVDPARGAGLAGVVREHRHVRRPGRSGNYPRIEFGGSQLSEFLLTPQSEQRVQAILSRIQPGGGSGDEPYQLPGDVEFLYIVDGTLEVSFPDGVVAFGKGDAVTFEPSTHRSFRVPGDAGPATVLWVIAPGLPRAERRGAPAL